MCTHMHTSSSHCKPNVTQYNLHVIGSKWEGVSTGEPVELTKIAV